MEKQTYEYRFICKNKGIIKTNDRTDYIRLTLHDKDGEAAWQRFYPNGKIFYKIHWKDDKCHNLKEAARVWYNEKGKITHEFYYIEGVEYTKKEWQDKVKELKESKQIS